MTLTNSDWCTPEDPNYSKPTGQAIRSKEIKELYLWWTTVYPNRPDPHDASGWSEYCESLRIKFGTNWIGRSDKDTASKKAGDKALKLTTKIEKAYDKEDEQMMIRLIKIRDSLWT
jgi:hypothetical protein